MDRGGRRVELRRRAAAWLRDQSAPLAALAVSRLWLLVIVAVSLGLVPMASGTASARTLLVDPWTHWDGEWYRRIAVDGYTNLPVDGTQQRDTAFFPLYPLAVRLAAAVVGDVDLAGILVSNAALLAALIVLYRLARRHVEPGAARLTLWLLALFPFSYFLSAEYSESLFLLTVVGAFDQGERGRWWAAALAGALAGLTRVTGLLIVPGLLVLYLEQRRFGLRRVGWEAMWIPAAWLGPLLHAAFLQVRFGEALLFIRSQYVPGWGAGVDAAMALGTVRALLTGSLGGGSILPLMHALHLVAWTLALAGSIAAWRRLPLAYGIWTTLMVLASFTLWRSAGRYAVTLFPLFMLGGIVLSRRRAAAWVLAGSALGLAVLAVLFGHSIWTG